MQQKPEDHKDLKHIVNKLPLPGGQKPFPGMICQAQDGELQKYKGSKQAGQANVS